MLELHAPLCKSQTQFAVIYQTQNYFRRELQRKLKQTYITYIFFSVSSTVHDLIKQH
jgi:hypothetical protein